MSKVSRKNLDIQVAFQAIAKRIDTDGVKVAVIGAEDILSGYVAYENQIAAPFRLTSEDWPPRDEVPEGEEIPKDVIGVFEPERANKGEPVFYPLEKYLENFDINDYEEGDGVFLNLKT